MLPIIDCRSIKIQNEKAFQWFLTERLRKNGWFVAKFSDQAMWYKPYDFVCEYKTGCFHVELKYVSKTDKVFYKSKIRPNQHASMQLISKYRPEWAIIWIYVAEDKRYYMFVYNDLMALMKNKTSIDLKTVVTP
jgi:penicillin-binding protein-related factor A (putative recombinase)